MAQPIAFVHQNKISLHLLKSEIDRRIELILNILHDKSSVATSKHLNINTIQQNSTTKTEEENLKKMQEGLAVEEVDQSSEENSSEESSNESEIKGKMNNYQNRNPENAEEIIQDFINENPLDLNFDSKVFRLPLKTTERHKKRNKQNKVGFKSQKKKNKKISRTKTPVESNFHSSKTTSAMKRHSFNTNTEERSTVSRPALQRMREQVRLYEGYYEGQRKKYSFNNNVRLNMLRRIEGMSEQMKESN